MEIMKINASDYGLEENKAKQIADQFKPMLDKMVELEKEANKVFKLDVNDPESSGKAKELRMKYVKVRTGTAEIHKQQKGFYLQAGRYVDGWKNTQLFASEGIEKKLMNIEKHAEILENERRNKLKEERMKMLKKYDVENVESLGLSLMSQDVWENFLEGTKVTFENKKDAEAKAEAKRIEKERLEKQERERIEKENEDLRKEAEDREKIAEKERKESEEKLKTEREAKEKAEKELKEKQEAEEKAAIRKKEAIENELKKGDADKINDLIGDLEILKTKYEFKSAGNKSKYKNVGGLIEKIVTYINN